MKEGWLCPRCKKVNAPFIAFCDCKENIKSNIDWILCSNNGEITYHCSVDDAKRDKEINISDKHSFAIGK